MGDFNSHHLAWNFEKSDRNGNILFAEMNAMGFNIVNDKTKPHMSRYGMRDSNIDLIFATENISSAINCKQGEDS